MGRRWREGGGMLEGDRKKLESIVKEKEKKTQLFGSIPILLIAQTDKASCT